MQSKFLKVDDYLPAEMWTGLLAFFEQNVRWSYGWQSDADKSPLSHWNQDFLKVHRLNQEDQSARLAAEPSLALLSRIWSKLRSDHLPGHSLVRCYCNAHSYGVEGDVHVDSNLPGNTTTIVYVVPRWQADWAGETVLINEFGDVVHAVVPRPNRIMIFDGRIQHCARAVHRKFTGLRVTLMFKSCEEESPSTASAELRDFLVSRGADKQPHGRRTLLAHLEGVHRVLAAAGLPADVCNAGLFHSVYGTSSYQLKLLDVDDRQLVRDLIGARAEEIAWAFCTLPMRAQALDLALQCGNHDLLMEQVRCSHSGRDRLWRDLIALECANLLEQHALHEFRSLGRRAREIGMVDADGFCV